MSVGSERSGVAPRLCGQRIGHFTHFAFTVNFTDYVKTKPDSGFTVKSRTLHIYLTDMTHKPYDTVCLVGATHALSSKEVRAQTSVYLSGLRYN